MKFFKYYEKEEKKNWRELRKNNHWREEISYEKRFSSLLQ